MAGSFKIQVLKRSQTQSLWPFVRHLDIHYFNRLQRRNEWNQLWMCCDKANMMGWHQKFNLNCSGFKYYWVKYYKNFDISFGYVWKVSVKFWECPEQWDTRYKEVCVLAWHGPLDFHQIWKSVTITLGCILLIRWHGALAHASLKAWGGKGRTVMTTRPKCAIHRCIKLKIKGWSSGHHMGLGTFHRWPEEGPFGTNQHSFWCQFWVAQSPPLQRHL